MEEAPENSKESSHSAHANGVNEWLYQLIHEDPVLCLLFVIKVVCLLTSSGTARILVKPLRNTTNTFLAPQRSAEVAQSNAVSPAPSTTTLP